MQGLRCEVTPSTKWTCRVFASAPTKGLPIPRHCTVPIHAFYIVTAQLPVAHARLRPVTSRIDREEATNC